MFKLQVVFVYYKSLSQLSRLLPGYSSSRYTSNTQSRDPTASPTQGRLSRYMIGLVLLASVTGIFHTDQYCDRTNISVSDSNIIE